MTPEQRWLSRRYILYKGLSSLWFGSAVWLYFYRLYVTDQQTGIIDGVGFAIGLLAEVPSGALADRFGRDKLVRIGLLLSGLGFIAQALFGGILTFFVMVPVTMIGVAFVSGADEALFFDKLKFNRNSLEWRKLVTRGTQVSVIASFFAVVIGGFAYKISPGFPMFLSGLGIFLSAAAIWPIQEVKSVLPKTNITFALREYLSSIKQGFAQFLQPELFIYAPLILSVQGLFYAFGWGLLKVIMLSRFHFEPTVGAVVISISGVASLGVLLLLHRYARRISEKQVLLSVAISAALGLFFAVADIGALGFLVILVLYVGSKVLTPYMSEALNLRVQSKQRATVLSVASFLSALPYIFLAPIIGILNTQGRLEYFFVVWGVLIFVSVFVYIKLKKNDLQLETISPIG